MGRVVVVGSFNVDHVWRVATLPKPGATLSGEYASGPGGKGWPQLGQNDKGENLTLVDAVASLVADKGAK